MDKVFRYCDGCESPVKFELKVFQRQESFLLFRNRGDLEQKSLNLIVYLLKIFKNA